MTSPWTDADVAELRAIAAAHNVQALDLVKVMAHESGCSPAALHHYRNAAGELKSGAAGLIQLEPENLRAMGYGHGPDGFARETVATQLPFVSRYLSWFPAVNGRGLAGLYCAFFIPAQVHVTDNLAGTVCGRQGPFASDYAANIGFDTTRKGWITGADLVAAAEQAFADCAVAQDIARRLAATDPPLANPLAGDTRMLAIPGTNDTDPPPGAVA